MAEVQATSNGAPAMQTAIHTTSHIPISQLTPLLLVPGSRSIKAVVTLTWPFSSISGSVAFLLAEPDFRLRRIRGQVRVQFAGSSAKAIAKAGIASGDEVLLCLEGVEFVQNEGSIISTPGRGVEFELKFTERLVLEFRADGSEELKRINIDHPEAEPEIPTNLPIPEEPLSPLPPAPGPETEKGFQILAGGEWSSPAFIKRARTSYGSLFDADYDPFAEPDGHTRERARKRTRLSSSWRYRSHSPTPEPEDEAMEEVQVQETPVKPAPVMMDEACQTTETDENSAAEALADFSRQATNVGGTAYDIPSEAPLHEMQESYEVETVVTQTIVSSSTEIQLPVQNSEVTDTPQSPRLLPIPSDSLPLVSPLMPLKTGLSETIAAQVEDSPAQNLAGQASHLDNDAEGEEEVEENLYNASPIRRREATIIEEAVDDQSSAVENVEAPLSSEPHNINDQSGGWQSINAPINEAILHQGNEGEGQYEEAPQDMQFEEELEFPMETRYPPLEDELEDNAPVGWNIRHDEVEYPDILDDYQPRGLSTSMEPPPARSAAMSRSQSAMSEQIDLTEDSDNDEPLQPAIASPYNDGLEEYDEEFEEEFEEQFDEEEEEHLQASRYETGGKTVLEDQQMDEEDYDEEDGSEEEEETGRGNAGRMRDANEVQPRMGYYDNRGDEEGSEAEDYDEEESDEGESEPDEERGQKQVNQGPPVVIEILSSDDEAEPAPPRKVSQEPRQTQRLSRSQQGGSDNEETGEPAGSDGDGQILTRSDSDDRDSLIEDNGNEENQSLLDEEEGDRDQDVSESEESEEEEFVSFAPLIRGLNPEGAKVHRSGRLMQRDESMEVEEEVEIEDEEEAFESQPQRVRYSQSPSKMKSQRGASQRPFLQHKQSMDGPADEASEAEVDYPELSGDEISQLEVESAELVNDKTEIETSEVKSGDVEMVEVEHSEDKASETEIAEDETSETELAEVQTSEVKITEVETSEIENGDIDTAEIETTEKGNVQLPTPLDTQFTEVLASEEQSFTSVASNVVAESEHILSEQDIQMIIEASENALDVEMSEVEEYVRIESPESESAIEDKIVHLPQSFLDAQLVGSTEDMEEIMEIPAVELGHHQRQASNTPDDHSSPESVEEITTSKEEIVPEPDSQLDSPSSPAVTDDNTEAENSEEEYEESREEQEKEASAELEINSRPTPTKEPVFGPFDEESIDIVDEARDDTPSSSSPAAVPDEPLPETLEEESEQIIEDGIQKESEEQESNDSGSVATETLEKQMQHIIEEAERQAAEELRSSSAVPRAVSETLEEEFSHIIEEAEEEAIEELRSSIAPRAVSETLEEEFDHIVEKAAEHAHIPAVDEIQEGGHFLRKPHQAAHVHIVEEVHASSHFLRKPNQPAHVHTADGAHASTHNLRKVSKPGHDESTAETVATKPTADTASASEQPRRSTRHAKTASISLDQKENIRPVTPQKPGSRQSQDQVSPMVVLDSLSTPKGHDASLELALAATDSPVKHDLRSKPPSTPNDTKLRLSRALRTELSEFSPLKVIRYHINQKLDVLGIATTSPPEPQRAKGGPRHYSVVFTITDPSIAPSGVAEIQVFRPYKEALPRVEIGDGVLLRNFQVKAVTKGFALQSMADEGSSWAVFKGDGDGGEMEVEVRGPPVEYGDGEKAHIKELKEWFASLDNTSMRKIERANGDKKGAAGTPGKDKRKGISKS